MSRTQLILLGTGTPNLEPQRFQSSLAVVVDDRSYIVDCGGGTMQRISQAYERYQVTSLAPKNLSRLFLTHLHPDHTVGLPDLLIAPWVLGRTAPLTVYGPAGTSELCDHLLAAYSVGIGEHRDGLAPIPGEPQVNVHQIEAGTVYQDELVTIEAFRVQHGTLDAFGYKFITPDKVIVISGDTGFVPQIIEQAHGCDILVHEVYSAVQFETKPAAWQAYHAAVHTSTKQLAEIGNRAKPGLIVLVHELLWGTTADALLSEIQADYGGQVVFGQDLDRF